MPDPHRIAYFSMEIAADPRFPTYSGGLGILAGDCIRSAADIGLPLVAVTLVHREGYFHQSIDASGMQHESPFPWNPAEHLSKTEARVAITLQGRKVHIAAWKLEVKPTHPSGRAVPLYFLDTDLPENHEDDRAITARLYLGDLRMRILQEAVLGIGGVLVLRALGYKDIGTYHMNEGHAALLTIELLAERSFHYRSDPEDPRVQHEVKSRGVFTTHTPIAAGHDRFPLHLVGEVLGVQSAIHEGAPYVEHGHLNMTLLAMHHSRFVNGVAKRHGEVSRDMLGDPRIDFVTNGVHAPTWACPEVAALLDAYSPGWRADERAIMRALFIPDDALQRARAAAKKRLIDRVNALTGAGLDPAAFTIGFARRATGYKRADLMLRRPDRLRDIARKLGPIQIIYAGKAHPHDHQGKEIIRRVIESLRALAPDVKGLFLPEYDFANAQPLVAGVDLWVNTPVPPLEASGTSGMKAALNGVPSLSTPDGWWLEGEVEGLTGWTIGRDIYAHDPLTDPEARASRDAEALYDKLEHAILPVYKNDRAMWISIVRHAIGLNGSRFNTNRVMREYRDLAYSSSPGGFDAA